MSLFVTLPQANARIQARPATLTTHDLRHPGELLAASGPIKADEKGKLQALTPGSQAPEWPRKGCL